MQTLKNGVIAVMSKLFRKLKCLIGWHTVKIDFWKDQDTGIINQVHSVTCKWCGEIFWMEF